MAPTLLIVDDDSGHRKMLTTLLSGWGYPVMEAESGEAAIDLVRTTRLDAVLMDVRMAKMDGIEATRTIRSFHPGLPILIMTAHSSVASAREALKAGAYDYLTKPIDFDELRLALDRALDHTRLAEENRKLRSELAETAQVPALIGSSPAMRPLFDMIGMVAPSEATILITGQSGTGKERVARAIHALSPRAEGPMVAVNCAALSESLLESELFGHEKGAFTGAEKKRDGRFVAAGGGTLFLDEVGEMALPLQAKLLRAIQEREIQRVGSDKAISVDVRILAATNRDLKAMAKAGSFREDLFYRLNVITLEVPALKDRTEDIPLLAQHFLEKFAATNRKNLKGFTPRAMDRLRTHDWPGNVRELENAVERAVILSMGDTLPESLFPGLSDRPVAGTAALSGDRSLSAIEKDAVAATLEKTGGNKSEAARVLGITRATLHAKLRKYDIPG